MIHTLDLTVSHISFLLTSGVFFVFLCSSCFMYIDLCFDIYSDLLILSSIVFILPLNALDEFLISNTLFCYF